MRGRDQALTSGQGGYVIKTTKSSDQKKLDTISPGQCPFLCF